MHIDLGMAQTLSCSSSSSAHLPLPSCPCWEEARGGGFRTGTPVHTLAWSRALGYLCQVCSGSGWCASARGTCAEPYSPAATHQWWAVWPMKLGTRAEAWERRQLRFKGPVSSATAHSVTALSVSPGVFKECWKNILESSHLVHSLKFSSTRLFEQSKAWFVFIVILVIAVVKYEDIGMNTTQALPSECWRGWGGREASHRRPQHHVTRALLKGFVKFVGTREREWLNCDKMCSVWGRWC